jgi:hypothetical protein
MFVDRNANRPHENSCTGSHGGILVGRAYDEEGTFGAFIAKQPVGTEIVSVSNWLCRWTGEYRMSRDGHRAAVLIRIRNVRTGRRAGAGGEALIHTCLSNCWSVA